MRAQATETTVVSFNLPTELVEHLRSAARRRECSMSAVVRVSLRHWLASRTQTNQELLP